MKYIYHFCCIHQEKYGQIQKYDGIAELKEKILSMEDYTELKESIIESFSINANTNGISIESLTLIGEVDV